MGSQTFSYTRFSTFSKCPKKHSYMYEEQLRSRSKSLSLTLGDLWHRIVEAWNKKESVAPLLEEYEKLFYLGATGSYPADLMEHLFVEYFKHYTAAHDEEELIGIEINVEEEIEDGDKLVGKIDKIYKLPDGTVVLRDTKTTGKALKYTHADVLYNQQLLLYVPYAESKTRYTISAIEIDEVRLDKLEDVPINANGKPTTDKRRLSLVTYERYVEVLESLKLEKEAEYLPILEYLSFRGHPLFKRTRVQLLDNNTTSVNLDDMADMYHMIKAGASFRVRGPLCNFCEFKALCELDMHKPDEASRKIITDYYDKSEPKPTELLKMEDISDE